MDTNMMNMVITLMLAASLAGNIFLVFVHRRAIKWLYNAGKESQDMHNKLVDNVAGAFKEVGRSHNTLAKALVDKGILEVSDEELQKFEEELSGPDVAELDAEIKRTRQKAEEEGIPPEILDIVEAMARAAAEAGDGDVPKVSFMSMDDSDIPDEVRDEINRIQKESRDEDDDPSNTIH